MSQPPERSRQPPPPQPVPPVDPKLVCSTCTGLTIKLQGQRPACYGITTKTHISLEGLTLVEREEPMEPNAKVYILGRSLYSERLHKADKPPFVMSPGFEFHTVHSSVPAAKTSAAKGGKNAVPDTNTANKENPSQNNVPGVLIDKLVAPPPTENRVQKPNTPAPADQRTYMDRWKKGAETQLDSMRVVYDQLSTNFPERFQRSTVRMYHSTQATWTQLKSIVHNYIFALMEIYHFESNAMTKLMVQSPRTSVVSDDEELKKLGYEQVLYRGLGAFSNFAFGFTEVALLVSFTSQYGFGLRTGGPATIFWGFLVVFLMNTIVSFCMAEICSAYPSAGSVYHWSAQLVPAKYAPLASYICGWFNFVGNAAGDSSFAFFFAQFLNSAIVVSGGKPYFDDDVDNEDNTVGISIAILLVWSLLNMFRVDQVGWINNVAAFCHAGGILIIIIALLAMPDNLNTNEFVFTKYVNQTGFTDKSYVVVIGLLTGMYSFAGYEASAHMAEETGSASTAAPWGIINTVLATGIGGIIYILALLYSTDSINAALAGPSNNAATNVFISSCGSKMGQFMTWIVVLNIFFAGVSSVAITGRITFSLMRDKAFPYGEYFSQVHPTYKSPVYSILFVFVIDCFLQLLPLIPKNGDTAFESIVGLSTIGFQVSYGIPILLKLVFNPSDFPVTPMALGGWSFPLGVVSCLWLFGSSFFFFLPTLYPVTNSNMNWLTVVTGGVFLMCALNWVFNSQYTFRGPKRHDEATSDSPGTAESSSKQHNPLTSNI